MELAGPLDRFARFELSEQYRALASTALRMRHKHSAKLATTQPEDLDDGQLAETVLRLKAWIADQEELPIHPDSELARRARAADEAAPKDV